MLSRSTCLIACCVLGFAALAADEPRAEFTAKAGDYDAPFGEASAAIKQIILELSKSDAFLFRAPVEP